MAQHIGIDEVGRGSLAGPLCIAAVFLCTPILGLRDSKVLTAKARELLALNIKKHSYMGLGWVSPSEIDSIGMGRALRVGAERAVKALPAEIIAKSIIIIDGSINLLPEYRSKTIVKADASIDAVMAASIVAKVARDNSMVAYSAQFKGYDLENNKGYGTATHLRALAELGGSPIHRYSFEPLKSMVVN